MTEQLLDVAALLAPPMVRDKVTAQLHAALHSYRRQICRFVVLPLDQLRALPTPPLHLKRPGVYFLWYGPELVYVGKSKHVANRISSGHVPSKKIFSRSTYFAASEDLTRAFERIFIVRYRPRYNEVT